MTYKGFEINDYNFLITKNGKPVFRAYWQLCSTLEDAKTLIDSSIMTKDVFDKFPNLSKIDLSGICELENGAQAADQAERWANNEHEKQLHNETEN